MAWSMDDWKYVERQVVVDPKGRRWSIALMDVLGQEGDPEVPNALLELQYSAGRYFTVIYADNGAMQREHGFPSLPEAMASYLNLIAAVANGTIDPAQPIYRADLEDGN